MFLSISRKGSILQLLTNPTSMSFHFGIGKSSKNLQNKRFVSSVVVFDNSFLQVQFNHIFVYLSVVFIKQLTDFHYLPLQGSQDLLFNILWNPANENLFLTNGKSHLVFWTYDPEVNLLSKKMAIFEVSAHYLSKRLSILLLRRR